MTKQTQLVLGSGPLGRAVINELARRGMPMLALNRSGRAEQMPDGVQLRAADLLNTEGLAALAAEASHIYLCAQPAYGRWPLDFPPLMRSVAEASARAGARLIFGDNLYMYGPVEGPIHDGLPDRPAGPKAQTRARMAAELLAMHAAGRLAVTIGRASDFFGPYVEGSHAGDRVFPNLLAGKPASFLGSLDQPHSWAYIEDFGRALVTLAHDERAYGRTWIIPHSAAISARQFAALAAEQAGVKAGASAMPEAMRHALKLFIPILREMDEVMYQFNAPFVVDDGAFRATFGEQATPIEEALRRTLAWYRARGAARA